MTEKIETIFDHNVTEEEIELLFGMTGYTEEYLQKKLKIGIMHIFIACT